MSEKNFTAEERDAMKAKLAERKTTKSRAKKSPEEARAEGTAEIKAKIADMPDEDRMLGEKVFAMVAETAPHLMPRTYYGMPAWGKDGKVLCFFQPASKFKTRYGTVSFDETAQLDDGPMWPVSYAVIEVTAEVEQTIRDLVRRAAPTPD